MSAYEHKAAEPKITLTDSSEKTNSPPVAAKAVDAPSRARALATLGQAAAAAKWSPEPDGGKSGAFIGRIGSMLVYIETEAKNIYEPVKVWIVEISATARGAIEVRAGPVIQKLQAAGQPVVVYMAPIYAKVTNGVLSVRTATGDKAVAVKWSFAAYGAASEFADVRYKAVCGLTEATMATIKARGLELYTAGQAKALPCYVKAKDTTVLYCQRVKDGSQYVETRVGDIVLKIKVGAGETATEIKSALLSRYAAVSDFAGGYIGPVAAKLAAMFDAIMTHFSSHWSPLVAKAHEGRTFVCTKACDIAVVVKVKSLAVKDTAVHYKGKAMQYPSTLLVQVKDGCVYMKTVVDGKGVVIKARLSDVTTSLNSALLHVGEQAKLKTANALDTAHVKCLALRAEPKRIAVNPNARIAAASAVGGAAVVGAGGGAVGLVAGGTLGAACGVPLSLFTFGLSIPMGAAVGSAAGLCAGAVAGGTAGLVGGGAAGHKIYQKRDSIAEGFNVASSRVSDIKGMAADMASMYKTKVAVSTAGSASYVRSRLAGGTGGADGNE